MELTRTRILVLIIFGGLILFFWLSAFNTYRTAPRNEQGELYVTYKYRRSVIERYKWVPPSEVFSDAAYATLLFGAIGYLFWRYGDDD